MATDTERNFKGTNFAVITVIVLALLMIGVILFTNVKDSFTDGPLEPRMERAVR